jgi:predicted deacetylase
MQDLAAGKQINRSTRGAQAEYLLRFDDFCPTMSRTRWHRFLPLIREFGIKPILSVVPDNQNPELMLSNPDPGFWIQMKQLAGAGATIAMQGFHNVCASHGKSLIGSQRETEFAGVDEGQQREWIRSGLSILRGHGLEPRLFVAPHRGFDDGTLRALGAEGFCFLSDGFGKAPYSRGGIVWIPQQISLPEYRSTGLWTISIPCNSAPNTVLGTLGEFLRRHAGQFTSFDRVLKDYEPAAFGRAERWRETAAAFRMRVMGSDR